MVSDKAKTAAKGLRVDGVLCSRYLPLWLGALGALLCLPAVGIGFHLDDLTHRHLFSDLPLADDLRRAYQSPFGIANGSPESIQWQIEQGYAPWWTKRDLLLSMWRPISTWTHGLDARWFFDSPALMHLHSLAWWFVALVCVTLCYRQIWGRTNLAGFAALLYALDHTHGFAVGWIANRNALLSTAFAVAALWAQYRTQRSAWYRLVSPLCLLAALLSGEAALAVMGYMVGHAVWIAPGSLRKRFGLVAPHLILVVGWRIVYRVLGRGAHGSGLYIDPGQEPFTFLLAVLERLPVLLLGALGLPPAEAYVFADPWLQVLLWCLGLGLLVVFGALIWPLVRADRQARVWAFGALTGLVPMCSTHPHNRLLYLVGLGLMGLLAQLVHGYLEGAPFTLRPAFPWAPRLTRLLVGFRLWMSPVLLPAMACSVAFTTPIQRGLNAMVAQDAWAGETLVVLHAQDYFQVKLLPTAYALAGAKPPAQIVALSFGKGPMLARRLGPRTLELEWPRGLLADPLDALYRDPRDLMPVGYTVQVEGVRIQVTGLLSDGRVRQARVEFDRPLDSAGMHWVRYHGRRWYDVDWGAVHGSLRTKSADPLVGL